MPARPSDLPDFTKPPVTEVVLSLQFGSLVKMQSAHIGFLWAKWRTRYPKVTEQVTLAPVFETFSAPTAPGGEARIQFEQLLTAPLPRYWFESVDETSLCQVQQNRIVHNWRKREADYPRYESIRDELSQDLDDFEAFLREEDLGTLRFNQSEISYINTIDLPDSANPHAAVEQVVSVWSRLDFSDRDLEDVVMRARYLIKKDGSPHARLHVSLTPAIRRATLASVIQLDLTFRGKPEGDDRAAALVLLDEGRAAIVKAFAEITTPDMHKQWGRNDE